MPYVLKVVKELNEGHLSDLRELYRHAGWLAEEDSGEWLQKIPVSSAVFVAAFSSEGRLIGAGRALSDKISDGYIQDITVLPDFRRLGIGGAIVRRLAEELRQLGVDWIGLIGVPGTEKFYRELGFERLDNHIPMKYKV